MPIGSIGYPPENETPFLVERARAINGYATVEQAVSNLFADLLGTSYELGGIVFFRITNASARNAIIETLLKKKYGATFDAFWSGVPNTPHRKGLFTLIRQLDQRRNEIVHWTTVTQIGTTQTLVLMRPVFWAFQEAAPQSITTDDMAEFTAKASFTARAINMFSVFARGALDDHPDLRQTWHDICQRPCIYPPPADHPLSLTPPESEIPPQS